MQDQTDENNDKINFCRFECSVFVYDFTIIFDLGSYDILGVAKLFQPSNRINNICILVSLV